MWLTNDDTDPGMAFDEGGRMVDLFDVRDDADQFVDHSFGPCGVALDDAGNAFVIECFNAGDRGVRPAASADRSVGQADGLPFGSAYVFGPDGRLYAIAGGYRGQAVASPGGRVPPSCRSRGLEPRPGWADTEPSEHSIMAALRGFTRLRPGNLTKSASLEYMSAPARSRAPPAERRS